MSDQYHHDYDSEPIGGGNPYYRCVHCHRSDPEINGRLEGHLPSCEYRQRKERDMKVSTCTTADCVASLAIPDECPHIIWFDDQDQSPIVFAGPGAKACANAKFQDISTSWNAHLFARIARNSSDDRFPSASVEHTLRQDLARACADTDKILHLLGIDPGQARAPDGALNFACIQPAIEALMERARQSRQPDAGNHIAQDA